MGDATVKPSAGDDLILSNDDGSAKIEVNEGAEIKVTIGTAGGDDFGVYSGSATPRLNIEGDSGQVGIGVADPTELFEVQQNSAGTITKAKIDNEDNTNAGSHSTLQVSTGGSSSGDPMVVFNNRITNWTMGMDNSDSDKFKLSETQDNLASDTRVTIASGGDFTLDSGNLIIGTAGKGIDFHNYGAGSPASNRLSDYEEGSFSITHGSIYGTTGYYTKIGNTVFIRGEIKSGAISSNSDFTFDLPFTSSRQAGGIATGITDPMKRFYLTVANSATTCRVEVVDGAANNNFWYFSLQYETSA